MKWDLGPEAGEPAMAPLSRELQDYFDQLLQGPAEPAAPVARSAPETLGAARRRPYSIDAAPAQTGRAAPAMRAVAETPSGLSYAEPLRPLPRPLPPLAPPTAPSQSADKVAPAPPSRPLRTGLERSTAPQAIVEPTTEAAAETGAAVEVPLAAEPVEVSHAAVPGIESPSPRHTGAFEVLLFRVGGLSLAVPLTALGVIRPLDRPPTPLFGQAAWYIGVVAEKQGTARVVDTAQLVMPERYRTEMREAYRYIIALHDSEWALAVDEIVGTVTLRAGEVRWRSQGGKRPWLAGTVVEHMCALLDAEGLDQALGQPVAEHDN